MNAGNGRAGRRRGLASLEVVMATAVSLPAVVLLYRGGVVACRNLYHAIGSLVGWPLL